MAFLTLIRVGSPKWFRKYRRYNLLGAFIVAAMLTPPDPVTQCLMAIPLVMLYEVGIMASAFIVGNRKEGEEEPPTSDPPVPAAALPPPSPDSGTDEDSGYDEADGLDTDEDVDEEEDPEELQRERELADAEAEAARAAEEKPADAEPSILQPPNQPTVARGSLAADIDSDNPDDMDSDGDTPDSDSEAPDDVGSDSDTPGD
jgi:sec-independent protein translocase protein TatC